MTVETDGTPKRPTTLNEMDAEHFTQLTSAVEMYVDYCRSRHSKYGSETDTYWKVRAEKISEALRELRIIRYGL